MRRMGVDAQNVGAGDASLGTGWGLVSARVE